MAIKKSNGTTCDPNTGSTVAKDSLLKVSGYKYTDTDGITKDIVLGRKRGRPVKVRNQSWYPQDKKVDACTLYAVYGSLSEVSKLTDIPEAIIRSWKNESWWLDITKQVYIESNEGLTAKISSTLDKTLELISHRLEHGDEIWDSRTGQLVAKPVDAKALVGLFSSLALQRRLGRNEPTSIRGTTTSDDRLEKLSQAFEKFAKMKTIEGSLVEGEEEEDAEFTEL
jgi:hypothetical protein